MRIKDIYPFTAIQLNEFNMSPSSLRMLASKINATAGMEFEMIVPGISINGRLDDYYDSEPDYSYDERPNSIDDVIRFFDEGGQSGRNALRDVKDKLENEYLDWLGDKQNDDWALEKEEVVTAYFRDADPAASDDEIQASVDTAIGVSNRHYRSAYEDWNNTWHDDNHNDTTEREWIRDNYNSMRPIENSFGVSWPYYTEHTRDDEGDLDIAYLADEFSTMIGRPVNHDGGDAHRAKREANTYIIEPDGSLQPDNRDESGLEFVSPPLPFKQLLLDLVKIKAWATSSSMKCYTNDSTGLHINVSLPEYSIQKLDYIKLALLMGNEHIIASFGREGNTYAKSAMGIIKQKMRDSPADVAAVLGRMKEHLSEFATKAIHSGNTQKYTTINTHDGYIEFRAPGGDWLNKYYDKIEPTLLRYVVALDAALDPTKYRQEYLKKLYQLLGPKDINDPIAYFARFTAGELSVNGLKSLLKNVKLQRDATKKPGTIG